MPDLWHLYKRGSVGRLLRIVTAILMETSEEWETGRAYLNLNADN